MDGAGGQEDVDAGGLRFLDCLPSAVDVFGAAASQAADDRTPHRAGDGLDRLEVAGRGDGKAGLDHVHAQVGQGPGQFQLLRQVHAEAGDCSPSRSVVSKIVIRRGGDWPMAMISLTQERKKPRGAGRPWPQGFCFSLFFGVERLMTLRPPLK